MELHHALTQISEIHAQVLRSEVFRGYRAVTMAGTAVIALFGAWVQSTVLPAIDVYEFLYFWVATACVCCVICGVDLLVAARRQRDALRVVLQFVPALVIGAVLTVMLQGDEAQANLLPGLWTLVYALGIFASRPYLPRAVGVVALYYLCAGVLLLHTAGQSPVPSPWGMGFTFAIGQAGLAFVLYRNLERGRDGC